MVSNHGNEWVTGDRRLTAKVEENSSKMIVSPRQTGLEMTISEGQLGDKGGKARLRWFGPVQRDSGCTGQSLFVMELPEKADQSSRV